MLPYDKDLSCSHRTLVHGARNLIWNSSVVGDMSNRSKP